MANTPERPFSQSAVGGDPFYRGNADVLSVADIVAALFSRKWMLFAVTLFFAAVAAGVSFLITPIYRSSALVVPADSSSGGLVSQLTSQFGDLASIAGISASGGNDAARLVAVLQSRQLAEQFIEENDLLTELFSERWDERAGAWEDGAEVPTPDDAYFRFHRDVRTVTEDVRSGLVTVTIRWRDRHLAADWANGLVQLANETERTRAIEHADESIEQLKSELQRTQEQEVRQSIFGLIEGQLKLKVMANVTEQYAFTVLDPAAVLDEKRRDWPQRKLITALGAVLGFGIGAITVLLLNLRQRYREAPVESA